jgi:hypothetical protein
MSFYILLLDTNDEFDALICEEQSIDLDLIGALLRTGTLAASPPVHGGLLLWIDASPTSGAREANARACILFSRLYGTRDPLVHGPLIVTGGAPEHPEAVSRERLDAALRDLFGIEPVHDETGQDGPS